MKYWSVLTLLLLIISIFLIISYANIVKLLNENRKRIVLAGSMTKKCPNNFNNENLFNKRNNSELIALKLKHNITQIIGLVFYGRKNLVKILIRYLDLNLKINGGILDKIVFAVFTNDQEDLNFIYNFTNRNSQFYESVRYNRDPRKRKTFKQLYASCQDNDIVFKIDDDIVFIKNGTFEKMLDEYLTGNHYILSANVINHSQLSYVHTRLRAILPFYEIKPYTWVIAENTTVIDDTVVFNSTYSAYSKWWKEGRYAAVAHESFFYHAYNNNLEIYNFGTWDFNSVGYHERVRINFIISWGRNLNRMVHAKAFSDETYLTIEMPKILKIHTISLGGTLVSHLAYRLQFLYLLKTNILEKYDEFSLKYTYNSGKTYLLV